MRYQLRARRVSSPCKYYTDKTVTRATLHRRISIIDSDEGRHQAWGMG